MTAADGAFAAEREELGRILGRLAQATEELDELAQQQARDLVRQREVWAAEDAERARLARRGELGPEWQRLQQRIDLGETSMTDIVSGLDTSAEATSVRHRARDKAAELYAEQVAALESDQPSELASTMTATRAEIDKLRSAMEQAVALGNQPWGSISLSEIRASAPLDEA